jgi:Arc/MetJ family transcription regulator
MASHMKTTIHIADGLLAEAQAIAAKENTTLKALVNEGLQKVVKERNIQKPFKLKDGSVGGKGVNPEFADASWEAIREAAYGDRGG